MLYMYRTVMKPCISKGTRNHSRFARFSRVQDVMYLCWWGFLLCSRFTLLYGFQCSRFQSSTVISYIIFVLYWQKTLGNAVHKNSTSLCIQLIVRDICKRKPIFCYRCAYFVPLFCLPVLIGRRIDIVYTYCIVVFPVPCLWIIHVNSCNFWW